jgi:hypothetical protein
VLHWIVTPFDPAGRPPTYPPPGNRLLHFVPTATGARIRVAANPRLLVRGRRTRLSVAVSAGGAPVAGADVRVRGKARRTGAAGAVTFSLRIKRVGRYSVRATRADLRPGRATVRVVRSFPAVCSAC